jgi:RsiW-degrading membrane proteinase PrsW (M82 family)
VLGIIGIILASLVMLFVVAYLIGGLGGDAFALGGIMALVPLAIVFVAVRWIDRWEPEPRMAIAFAFLWGAGVSVLIALWIGGETEALLNRISQGDQFTFEFLGAAIQAPIVEEGGKGLGLLILFLAARKHFDGPVDGLVYAAWVAGGFAFTENILYFGGELLSAGSVVNPNVFEIFFIRGLMSPFAHVMFTACIGIALGMAARRVGTLGAIGYFIVGLIPAMLLHAFWNGALFFVGDFYGYYAIIQFPLFLIAVFIVIFLRRQESRLTHDRLSEYASVGWFNPDEINALATPNGRRQAIAWAKQRGIGKEMKRYIRDATRLAFARQRIITGRNQIGAQADESALLAEIVAARASLKSATAAVPQQAATPPG